MSNAIKIIMADENKETTDEILKNLPKEKFNVVAVATDGIKLYEEIKGGYIDKMSFAFIYDKNEYDRSSHTNTITGIKIVACFSPRNNKQIVKIITCLPLRCAVIRSEGNLRPRDDKPVTLVTDCNRLLLPSCERTANWA